MQLEVFYHLVNHPEREITEVRQGSIEYQLAHLGPGIMFPKILSLLALYGGKKGRRTMLVLLLVKVPAWICLLHRHTLFLCQWVRRKCQPLHLPTRVPDTRFRRNSGFIQVDAPEVNGTRCCFQSQVVQHLERHMRKIGQSTWAFGNLSRMWYISSVLVCHWPKEVTRMISKSGMMEEKCIYPRDF